MENDPRWQNFTEVVRGSISAFDLQGKLEAASVETPVAELKELNDNINRIRNILEREFPEQTIPVRASIREAIDIFYKVNASGVSLTDAELALAQITGYWPEARDVFKKKLSELKSDGFAFRLDFVVYALLGCLYYLGSDMRKLHHSGNREKVIEAWERLSKDVLDYVVNILRTHAYVDHTNEINSVYALIPIIVFCYQKNGRKLSDREIKKLVKWFYYAQIRTRYVSQLPQKLDRDLRIIRDSDAPFDELLAVIEQEQRDLEITADEMMGRAVQHPLFSLARWYFKSKGAVCFTTGVGLRQNMGAKYQLENDHIFPYSRLKSVGYGKGNRVKYALAQEFANRAILTQHGNRAKSATTAKEYLQSVKQQFPTALQCQCVPDDPDIWELENYEEFLAERRKTLAHELNQFLKSITETEHTEGEVDLSEMIAEGESDSLEFKESLRWDNAKGHVNKKLEDAIVKTVSAFGNSDGGTLLIGVDDAGGIRGLDNDYASLSGDKDEFELHLRNLLNQALGKTFVAKRIEVTFPDVDDLEICQVDVQKATEPLVVRLKNKDGQSSEKLYVRSGNSSQEIALSEAHKYFNVHFS